MPLNKISRILMPALLSLSTASFAVQAAERGRIRSLQGNADLLKRDLAPGINTPTFVNGGASDSAALDNNVNNLEGLHTSQNRLSAPKSERDVLIEFYNATNGDNWENNTNWKSNKPLSEWYGVTTDNSGRVTKLILFYNQLTGTIPAALGNLTNLTGLELWLNQLTGTIPTALADLTNLTGLSLWGNQLTGTIPAALGNLTNLTGLELSFNQLTGGIPSALGNLTNLTGLGLSSNQLTGGIPSALGNLTNLTELLLNDNQLTGTIPPALDNLTLATLNLEGNQLQLTEHTTSKDVLIKFYDATNGDNWRNNANWKSNRPIGEWYGVTADNSGRVTELKLEWNQLTGEIPAGLDNLKNLEKLILDNNQLTGEIPADLGNLKNLEKLILDNNQLTGEIPADLGNLKNLKELDLWQNKLTGEIPAALGNLTNLTELGLSDNQLTGTIPPALGNLTLADLKMRGLIEKSMKRHLEQNNYDYNDTIIAIADNTRTRRIEKN